MTLESIMAKELEKERERCSALELEIIDLKARLKAFEPQKSYPPNQNANISDFRRFLEDFQNLSVKKLQTAINTGK